MDEEKLLAKKKWATEIKDYRRIADFSKKLAEIYFEEDRLEEAVDEYKEQLAACAVFGCNFEITLAHKSIAEVYVTLGEYIEAIPHQIAYYKGSCSLGNLFEQQKALVAIGESHFQVGRGLPEWHEDRPKHLAGAQDALQDSIKTCHRLEIKGTRNIETWRLKVEGLSTLASVFEEQKKIKKAIELMERAAKICKQHKLEEELYGIYMGMVSMCDRLECFQPALNYADVAGESGDLDFRAGARLAKAQVLLRIGKWAEAQKILVRLHRFNGRRPTNADVVERLLRIVATITRTTKRLMTEKVKKLRYELYKTLGDATAEVRCWSLTIDYYRQMLMIANDEKSSEMHRIALTRLIRAYRSTKRFEEAIVLAQREVHRSAENTPERFHATIGLADLFLLKAPHKSVLSLYNKALNIARLELHDREMEIMGFERLHAYFKATEMRTEAAEVQRIIVGLANATIGGENGETTNGPNVDAEMPANEMANVDAEMPLNETTNVDAEMPLNETTNVDAEMPLKETTSDETAVSKPVKRNKKGQTKLHLACVDGKIEEAAELIAAGHPTNLRDNLGRTPLHEAAFRGYAKIVELLIASGANVDDPGIAPSPEDDDYWYEPIPNKLMRFP